MITKGNNLETETFWSMIFECFTALAYYCTSMKNL